MERLSYDLHIHSCLSPCGDSDMTPANIAGMAAVKGLDVIALTDHNSSKNCKPLIEWSDQYGIIAIPGMELTTMEEVHVLCLFPTLELAMRFDEYIYIKLVKVPNREDIFGKQELCNEKDEIIGIEPNLLINSTEFSFDEVYSLVKSYKGVMIPAHIDKSANSLISNLGFVPDNSQFRCVEVKDIKNWHELKRSNPYLERCNVITDSDAHYLESINEPANYITVRERNIPEILLALENN